MEEKIDFQKAKLFPLILKFSIPAGISLLISAIYNIVDRIFIGNYSEPSALAGLSICFPISFMMLAIAITCSAGGATLFSVFTGKKEQDNMDCSFGNAFILVIVLELILTLILFIFNDPILKVFGVTETAYHYAIEYYKIVIIGCVFQGLAILFCDFVRVSGRPILGMVTTAVGAVANIVFDAIFIIGLDWGVKGAGWATVLGQIISTIVGAYLVFGNYTKVKIERKTFQLNLSLLKGIIACGFSHWIMQMSMGLISLVYNRQLGQYGGDDAISVYAVVASIMTFVIMPSGGISQGILPIIGNNFGAGKYRRVLSTLYKSCMLSVGITSIIWLVVMIFPEQILTAFGVSEEAIKMGISGLRFNFCITPTLGFIMLVTTFLQAISKPIPSIIITILRQVALLIPLIYILPNFWEINGIFIAQPISDLFAFITCIYLICKERVILKNDSISD